MSTSECRSACRRWWAQWSRCRADGTAKYLPPDGQLDWPRVTLKACDTAGHSRRSAGRFRGDLLRCCGSTGGRALPWPSARDELRARSSLPEHQRWRTPWTAVQRLLGASKPTPVRCLRFDHRRGRIATRDDNAYSTYAADALSLDACCRRPPLRRRWPTAPRIATRRAGSVGARWPRCSMPRSRPALSAAQQFAADARRGASTAERQTAIASGGRLCAAGTLRQSRDSPSPEADTPRPRTPAGDTLRSAPCHSR